jgi:hypothetical protein
MEGSMKMMSWSRYHCLSPSLLRAERRAAKSKSKFRKIWHRAAAPRPLPSAPSDKNVLIRYFQFVIQRFRT